MSNLTETATYDAGVYQLETTDPVQGGATGVSNYQGKNLANRTAYLKQHVDNLESGATVPPGIAVLASPAFSGSPTAPTQALGDNSTKLSNTAFVQATVGGRLSKSVAGSVNVTLTAVEAGNAILELTGLLTANIAVIVPSSPTRTWLIKNATSGAFTVTLKTAAGTGVVCTQGLTGTVFTDGTNVYKAFTDFDSIAISGIATAPTAAAGTNTTQLATTAFVTTAITTASSTAVQYDTSTGAAQLPAGTVAQRPANGQGKLRYNTDTSRFEGNNGSSWGSLGGATGGGTDAVFYLNDQTINNDYTVPSGQNAMTAGPITIASGKTVTVSSGSVWTVV
jgi:hypothetical protein